jgi:GTPase Era involved in 16S rRNA processing
LTDTSNSFPIEGKATCTIVASTTIMNCAKVMRANTTDRCDEELPLVVAVSIDEFDLRLSID